MASSTFHLFFQLSSLLTLLVLQNVHTATTSCYTSIFSFGDSLADTGNLLCSSSDNPGASARLPYGESFFHHPTGRFSDGRLIIDFIAQGIGIPLVPPYLAGPGDHGFRQGANFAVAGATALGNDFFRKRGLDISWTEYSLGTQIEWFKQLLPSLCSSSSDCKGILSNSLFLVGEIGGNDYNHPFFQGRTVDEIRTFTPSIISAISSAINVSIQLGAKTLLVPGNFPIGCVSRYLQTFQSHRKEDYDEQTGCVKWLNEFAEYHNRLLVDELDHLRQLHPHATIIYADYYKALLNIIRSPTQFGFKKSPFAACCGGGGGLYNANVACGDRAATVCNDPSKYVCWDGIHLTEAAYKAIAQGLLEGPYTSPPLAKVCGHIEQSAAQSQQHPTW